MQKEPTELTNYEQWQMERYGNVLATAEATPDGELFESGMDELNRLSEWIEAQNEQVMHEHE